MLTAAQGPNVVVSSYQYWVRFLMALVKWCSGFVIFPKWLTLGVAEIKPSLRDLWAAQKAQG